MSIYTDDISVAGLPEKVKKRIMKCARMEVENIATSSSCVEAFIENIEQSIFHPKNS